MKTHTHSTTTYTHTLKDGTELELELPFDPSPIMEYKDVLELETDTAVTIGYLADDTDCANPLEDCDGMGHIYECRRHGKTLRDYEQALGLADGGPNPHAVPIDVHEHGQVAYHVNSGAGPDWDVARAGAVWVPDGCARDELLRRAAVYRKGDIIEMRTQGSNSRPYAVRTLGAEALKYDDTVHPAFEHWRDAFQYLDTLDPPHQRDQAAAEQTAARELAAQACETYTDWRNGNCYGVVVVTYDKASGEETAHDAVWGFIGDDDAYASLLSDYFPKGNP